jgi:DNA-binding NarL/FixJ family response regulator
MDYTPLISATRASHARIQATPLDARLLIVSADPTPGFMLTAYERINPGLKLVAICTEADEAWRLLEQEQPNAAIVCSDLERGDGIKLCCALKQQHPALRLMLIGRSLRKEPYIPLWQGDCEVIALRQRGGGGRLYQAFHALFLGGAYCDPYLHELLLGSVSERSIVKDQLTPREMEILLGLVGGAGNGEIAQQLAISVPTVKQHMSVLLRKLQCNNRCKLATRALRLGLCSWGVAASDTTQGVDALGVGPIPKTW